jgi:hypothetical protein
MAADGTDFTDKSANVPPGFSLLQIDDLELGDRNGSEDQCTIPHHCCPKLVHGAI